MLNLRTLPFYGRLGLVTLSVAALTSAVLFTSVQAQTPASAPRAPRILVPIDDGQLVTLKGNVNPQANAQNDRGPVSASLPMTGMLLVLSRSPEDQAAFDAYVAGEYDPSSPNFHRWLTPAEIGQRFGPADSDVAALTNWLTSQGFAVKTIAPDRMSIAFSGAAGQVETAFHTQIHNLSVNGKMHIANMTDPQIPAALAPVVVGVKGLHNFFPHPLHKMGGKVQFNPDAHGWVRVQNARGGSPSIGAMIAHISGASAKSASSLNPDYYYPIPNSGGSVEEDVAPYDFAKIYNLPSTWPNTTNGSGQTIAIVGTSDVDAGDITEFRKVFGVPTGPTLVTAHGPDGDPGNCGSNLPADACNDGDLDENSLDTQWSGAVAPQAQIVLVTDAYNSQTNPTNDPIFDGAQWIVDNVDVSGSAVYGARIISVSYGSCEQENGTASNVAYNDLWQTAYSAGIAVFVATGDSGSPACDDGLDAIGNPYEAQYGLSVNAVASTPYDTAVGGTDFNWCDITESAACTSSDASKYWNTSNSSQQASAKGYVPEVPWNDTCLNPLLLPYFQGVASGLTTVPANAEAACNFVYNYWPTIYEESGDQTMIAIYIDTDGGSGGASNCVVNSTTGSTSSGGPNGSCSSSDDSTGSSYGNLTLYNDGWPKPSWQTGVSGIPSDGVRDLPDVSFFAGNGVLDSATLICVSNDDASCSDIANTATGENGEAEELGGTSVATPEMAGVMALINQKAGPSGSPNAELYTLAGKQTYSECSAESVTTSSSCYFNDIDQGTNAMPCDNGEATEGGAVYDPTTGEYVQGETYLGLASPNCSAVNAGDLVGTLSGYSAAAGYDLASGLGSLNIANVLNAWPAATVGTAAATIGINLGGVTSITSSQSLSVTVTVSGASGMPTGDVTLYDSTTANVYSSAQTLSSGSATLVIPANTFTSAGVVTLTAAYSGDSTYAASSNTASVTISGVTSPTETFALGSITSPAGINPGATATATVNVSSSNGYAGTITLSCALTGQPQSATNLPTCSPSGTIALSATTTSGSATMSVTTAATTVSALAYPKVSNGKGWMGMGGGAVLAFLVFLGIPARRRSWRAMLGLVVLIAALGSLSACGGGGGGGGGTTTIPGTTAGTYTFTVTAQGSPSPTSTPAPQTFTVIVN
jgi:subtilase family serine protease